MPLTVYYYFSHPSDMTKLIRVLHDNGLARTKTIHFIRFFCVHACLLVCLFACLCVDIIKLYFIDRSMYVHPIFFFIINWIIVITHSTKSVMCGSIERIQNNRKISRDSSSTCIIPISAANRLQPINVNLSIVCILMMNGFKLQLR